jgi:hypothetical protein
MGGTRAERLLTPLHHCDIKYLEVEKVGKVRTQVQLEEQEYEWLKREAYRRRSSVSAVLREAVDRMAGTRKVKSKVDISKAIAFVGKGHCGKRDVSIHHDDYLSGMRK